MVDMSRLCETAEYFAARCSTPNGRSLAGKGLTGSLSSEISLLRALTDLYALALCYLIFLSSRSQKSERQFVDVVVSECVHDVESYQFVCHFNFRHLFLREHGRLTFPNQRLEQEPVRRRQCQHTFESELFQQSREAVSFLFACALLEFLY